MDVFGFTEFQNKRKPKRSGFLYATKELAELALELMGYEVDEQMKSQYIIKKRNVYNSYDTYDKWAIIWKEHVIDEPYTMEKILNYSKKRKFPENYYTIYQMSKDELGKYLNVWMDGNKSKSKDNVLQIDEVWTVKKVNNETASHLYKNSINPIFIRIRFPYEQYVKNITTNKQYYNMKASICSIDDASYGIWWNLMPLDELERIRILVMKWINAYTEIDGSEFINYCLSLGADKDSIDYN